MSFVPATKSQGSVLILFACAAVLARVHRCSVERNEGAEHTQQKASPRLIQVGIAVVQTQATPAPWVEAFEPTEQTIRDSITWADRKTAGCSQGVSVPFKD